MAVPESGKVVLSLATTVWAQEQGLNLTMLERAMHKLEERHP